MDGAVFQASQSAGTGHLYGFGPLEDEAMALEEGVLFACDAGILDAMFECDAKIIFDDMIRVKELQSIS